MDSEIDGPCLLEVIRTWRHRISPNWVGLGYSAETKTRLRESVQAETALC